MRCGFLLDLYIISYLLFSIDLFGADFWKSIFACASSPQTCGLCLSMVQDPDLQGRVCGTHGAHLDAQRSLE